MSRRPDGALETDVLWDAVGPLLPGDINERLDAGYAYTSIATILTRLQAKGLVTRTPAGRAYAYEAAVDEPDLAVRRIGELLDSASNRSLVLSRRPLRHDRPRPRCRRRIANHVGRGHRVLGSRPGRRCRVPVVRTGDRPTPPVRALARRVNFSIERWADEAAAAACGDRRLVAVTLGKVALQSHPPTVAGFAGLGVAARVGALLEPPIPTPHRSQLLLLWSSLAVTAGFSLYQLHHLERLVAALCPH